MANNKIFTPGGQAVVEGVLMRSMKNMAVAVRKPNGQIAVKKRKIHSLRDKYKVLNLPFIRGILNMVEMLTIGVRELNYSANMAMDEEEEELGAMELIGSLALAFIFAIGMFKFVPLLLAEFASRRFAFVEENYIMFNLIDGIAKITLFILYIYIISFMKDVKRLFEYHGAEHKTVYCYEARQKLTAKNIRKFPTQHPRCGTSFIIIVLLLSIFVYTFIPQSLGFWTKLSLRILLLPIIAGISYELLKFSAKYTDNIFVGLLSAPGLLIQKITTKEPDENQIEVAKKALEGVLSMENQ